MHLLYVVPWAECFVHENKSISFYQPSPGGCLWTLSVYEVEGKCWQRQVSLETNHQNLYP